MTVTHLASRATFRCASRASKTSFASKMPNFPSNDAPFRRPHLASWGCGSGEIRALFACAGDAAHRAARGTPRRSARRPRTPDSAADCPRPPTRGACTSPRVDRWERNQSIRRVMAGQISRMKFASPVQLTARLLRQRNAPQQSLHQAWIAPQLPANLPSSSVNFCKR